MKKLFCIIWLVFHFTTASFTQKNPSNYKPSAAYDWLKLALEVTANDVDRVGARPTIQSRQLGITINAMYDAWAIYDDKAVGSQLGSSARRPKAERTKKNKEIAIAYAMYRTMLDQYPADKELLTKEFTKRGFNPNNKSTDMATPEGVGNKVAKALIDYRKNDGANQHGNEIGSNGLPFSDYTYYTPVQSYKKVINPDKWHPLPFVDAKGDTFLVNFLTPHWYRVKPFGLKSSAQFRAPEYPKFGSEQLEKEVQEVIDFNANLTPERKCIIEFMRDGPRSTGQAGHWLQFAQMVSVRDQNDLDTDVKLFFTVAITAMDAFIACWETKRYYDSSRPWTLVRCYNPDKKIKGWGGPDKGTQEIPANCWHPYSPANFVSPPFPAYVSGHSTVSGACAKVLELFTGSDRFGEEEIRKPGIITETPGDPISLPLPTFTATADMAGISRVMGGYHIQADNIEGLKMGRSIGHYLWDDVFSKYFDGSIEKSLKNGKTVSK
ncbi:MAG: vanadium-dependent haloperoxidase [Saprospiraceae bacterium]|nr:vanadium-dependent haloperoxidase [Saprospiraceae bacterium]